jgi:hypothetical protein
MTAIEHEVPTANGLVHVDEHPGTGPAVVMTHASPTTRGSTTACCRS